MLGSVLKSKMTVEQFRHELVRREVNAIVQRAKVVARRMAKYCLERSGRVKPLAILEMTDWMSGEMRKYGCNELLFPFAIKFARKELQ